MTTPTIPQFYGQSTLPGQLGFDQSGLANPAMPQFGISPLNVPGTGPASQAYGQFSVQPGTSPSFGYDPAAVVLPLVLQLIFQAHQHIWAALQIAMQTATPRQQQQQYQQQQYQQFPQYQQQQFPQYQQFPRSYNPTAW